MARPDSQLEPEGEALRNEAAKWLNRIEQAGKDEKTWMDDADKATKIYTGEGSRADNQTGNVAPFDFNILFANVETIVPAIINSPPAPDIRRRFGADDPAARDLAEILERAIRIQVDDGKMQIELEGMAQDAFLAGRGITRLRFKSDFESPMGEGPFERGDDAEETVEEERITAALDRGNSDIADEALEDAGQKIQEHQAPARPTNERIEFETVSWRDFRRGPAKRWADVPWIAFRHSVQSDDYNTFADADFLNKQTVAGEADESADAERIVWEVWERKTRSVIFVEENEKRIAKKVPDPLELTNFYPIHEPVQAICLTGRLMPVNPFSIYHKLADELDLTTKRIRAITKQLQVKGWYLSSASDLAAILNADDTEFIPVADAELLAAKGGIEGAIAFWPVEKLVLVLVQLYALREQTKQAIYEITGISDIVRGASRSSETATAQQIKTQWGSLRIQHMQRAMERAARDLFVMMAEIIPAKFSPETLQQITGIQMVPTEQDLMPTQMPMLTPDMPPEQAEQMQQQAQQAEEARQKKLAGLAQLQALAGQKLTSFYRIDVESDSTVKADLTRQKSEATEFMQASSGYFAAVAPLVN